MESTIQRVLSFLNQPLVSARAMRERRRRAKVTQRSRGVATLRSGTLSGSQQLLEGKLAAGVGTQYAVEDRDVIITGDTWVFGDLKIGLSVVVQCVTRHDGALIAKKVVLRS